LVGRTLPAGAVVGVSDTLIERARQLAEEGIEWCRDFKDGAFSPAPTRDGWTVEMHGLVDSHEQLSEGFLALYAALTTARERERELREALEHLACENCGTMLTDTRPGAGMIHDNAEPVEVCLNCKPIRRALSETPPAVERGAE
jgi:hypothetical protein